MEKMTKGSWLVHHTNKLQRVINPSGFENIFLSGKSGILLSAISRDDQFTISKDRLHVLADASNINKVFELPKILEVLKDRDLIDESSREISVLGVTTTSALLHTADIFESLEPISREYASLDIAEITSEAPLTHKEALEYISDFHKLPTSEAGDVITDAESIGFIDVEMMDEKNKLLFNGNIFRRDNAAKVKKVLSSLNSAEQAKLVELTELLRKSACLPVDFVEPMLGRELFLKVGSIGLFDVNIVGNSKEEVGFITLPAAFNKYGDAMVEDAFDLAKAFVSSITYGMTKSSYARGQIRLVERLLEALIRGESVGPVQAIAEDYKALELRGVVEVNYGSKKGRTGPMLKLLKKEIGELALQVINKGDASEHSLPSLPSAIVTNFIGPEVNREKARRRQRAFSKKQTGDMLSVLRTGRI